ncbi:hypothetical protein G5I_06737 [Acromyrmex echinatior]|uniref:Uncharacterized protein n=1 Tax=Acromyrmex echinatior TaxID=103372 RepID=F4WLV6_ACREC|nr:hypothetical protein G5I_06737 [Acromyrmex echinatior]
MTYWRRNSVQHSVMLPEAQPRRPQRHASRNGSREKQASSTTTFQLEKLVSRSNLNRTCAGSAQFLRSRSTSREEEEEEEEKEKEEEEEKEEKIADVGEAARRLWWGSTDRGGARHVEGPATGVRGEGKERGGCLATGLPAAGAEQRD